MLIMILLKSVEIASFVFGSVNVMQRVMNQIIDKISTNESKPKCKIYLRVGKVNYWIDYVIA